MPPTPAKPSGPRAYYRPKSLKPVTLALTDEGKQLLDLTAARTSASRSDVVEQLLRRFHKRVYFLPNRPPP